MSAPLASFPRQFVVAEDLRAVPSEWVRETCQGWSLWHCPHLSIRSIIDQEGKQVGWLLGDAIPRPGADPGPWRISERCGDPALHRFICMFSSRLEEAPFANRHTITHHRSRPISRRKPVQHAKDLASEHVPPVLL